MGRILLILTAGCLFATFLIIANSSFKTTSSSSPKSEDVSKKVEKDRTKKGEQSARAKSTRKDAVRRSKQSGPTNPDEAPMSAANSPEQESKQDDGLATVSGDAPVYSVNSRDSRIIKVLKKGEKVTTDLQVIDVQGRWTIVKKPDLSKPGFVLDENLQPANSKKKTENRQ